MSFPNAVDCGGVTYALYGVSSASTYGFLIDPEGKVVVGWSLGTYYTRAGNPYCFDTDIAKHVKSATDPYGIDAVPTACMNAYRALKRGQFAVARALAKSLLRARDEKIKGTAQKITAAADRVEAERLELMQSLAADGRAGELDEEIKAFLLAFPTSKQRFKLGGLASKAKRTEQGKRAVLAARNYERALALLKKNNDRMRSQALTLCRAVATQFEGTYHAKLCQALVANWPTGR